MTLVYKSILYFSLCTVIIYACSNKTSSNVNGSIKNDSIVVDSKHYYHKIDSFVDLFDRNEFTSLYEKHAQYPIEDSLCFYFSRLNKKELINDEDFRCIAGKLLEKAYLQTRESFYKPESFPVYNMEMYPTGSKISHHFALNIVLRTELCIDSTFIQYANMRREFVCIDSVVLILDKLPQMQNDPNHQKCMYLVTNNKTGGCKW